MNILTPLGYKDINLVNIGDQVIGYDMVANQPIINTLLSKELYTPTMDGYSENHGDFAMIIINGTISLYKNQSVFTSTMLVHAFELVVGDIIYDDAHNPITITSLSTVQGTEWWRLEVSGDHSYIGDNVLLHNPDRYWVGGGSTTDWNATGNTNWSNVSGGAPNTASPPTSSDVARFNGVGASANGTSTISAPITIQALNIEAGFTGTMVHNNVVTTPGSITLGANYTISGTSGIISSSGTATLTFNKTWPNVFEFTGASSTKTLGNSFTIQGLLTISTSGTVTINANTLSLEGGITVNGTTAGTSKIVLKGGTWSGTSTVGIGNSMDLDGNVTISGTVYYRLGTLKYISGTITYSSAILTIAGNTSLDLNGIAIIPQINTNATNTITLVSDLSVTNLNVTNATTINQTGTRIIYLYGNYTNTTTLTLNTTMSCVNGLTINSTTTINGTGAILIPNGITLNAGLSGTCKLVLSDGTWSQTSNGYGIGNNKELAGPITIGTNATIAGGSLTQTNFINLPVTLGSTLHIRGTNTINTPGMNWGNINFLGTTVVLTLSDAFYVDGNMTVAIATTISGSFPAIMQVSGNVTLSAGFTLGCLTEVYGTFTIATSTAMSITANLTCYGLLTQTAAGTINTSNSSVVNIEGGVTLTNNNIAGSAKLIFKSGTWSQSANTYGITNSLDINGNVTISGNVGYSTGTLTYVGGTVTTTGSTLNIRGNCTMNTSGITWNNVSIIVNTTFITLTSNLIVGGTYSSSATSGGSNASTFTQVVEVNGISLSGTNTILSGTAKIIFRGGTWTGTVSTGTQYVACNMDIDAGSNTVTFGVNAAFGVQTLKYISGTVVAPNRFTLGNNCIFENMSSVIIAELYSNANNRTLTLIGDLSAGLNSNVGTFFINKTTNEIVNCYGIFGGAGASGTTGVPTTFINGTADLYLKGGVYSTLSGINKKVYIDAGAGSISYSTTLLRVFTDPIVYLSGDITNMGFDIRYTSGTATIDIPVRVGFMSFGNSTTSNIVSPLQCTNVEIGSCLVNKVFPTSNVSVHGQLRSRVLQSGVLSGVKSSAAFVLKNGSNTQKAVSSSSLSVDINIDAGDVDPLGFTLIGYMTFSGLTSDPMKVTHISGDVVSQCTSINQETSSLSLNGSIIFDTGAIGYGCVYMSSGIYTFLSPFRVYRNFTISSSSIVFNGTAGFEVLPYRSYLNETYASLTIRNLTLTPNTWTFQAGVTYKLQYLVSSRNVSGIGTWTSSDPVQRVNLCFDGAFEGDDVRLNVNVVRFDASCGRRLFTHASTVTDCINISPFTDKLAYSVGQ